MARGKQKEIKNKAAAFGMIIRQSLNSIAENIKIPPHIQAAIVYDLHANDEDIKEEALKALVPFFVVMGLFLVKCQSIDTDNIPTAELAAEIRDTIGIEFIWDKIKRFYPEYPDIDGKSNAAGLDLARRITDTFLALDMKWTIDEGRRVLLIDIGEKAVAIPRVKSSRAKSAIFTMSKIAGVVFDPEKSDSLLSAYTKEDAANCIHVRTSSNKNVISLLGLDWDAESLKQYGISAAGLDKLTAFDSAIYTATSSLYYSGNKYINSKMVYQFLCGNKAKVNPTQNILKRISDSIEKMSKIRVTINAEMEVKARQNIQAEYRDYLLNTRAACVNINGVMLDCVEINTEPVLYKYSESKKQIARADVKMLDMPINNTTENIILKDYLLRRLLGMQNDKSKLSNVLRYATIYDYLGIKKDSSLQEYEKKKKRVRDTVKMILSDWKDKNKISGFTEQTEGRKIVKVYITL